MIATAPTLSEKQCTWCKAVLPAGDFRADSRRRDGLQSHCKDCQNAKDRRCQPVQNA